MDVGTASFFIDHSTGVMGFVVQGKPPTLVSQWIERHHAMQQDNRYYIPLNPNLSPAKERHTNPAVDECMIIGALLIDSSGRRADEYASTLLSRDYKLNN